MEFWIDLQHEKMDCRIDEAHQQNSTNNAASLMVQDDFIFSQISYCVSPSEAILCNNVILSPSTCTMINLEESSKSVLPENQANEFPSPTIERNAILDDCFNFSDFRGDEGHEEHSSNNAASLVFPENQANEFPYFDYDCEFLSPSIMKNAILDDWFNLSISQIEQNGERKEESLSNYKDGFEEEDDVDLREIVGNNLQSGMNGEGSSDQLGAAENDEMELEMNYEECDLSLAPRLVTPPPRRLKINALALEKGLISNQNQHPGEFQVSDEEKKELILEGFPVPTKLPLLREEKAALKMVRRKIKNKLSALESRKNRMEYLVRLEQKVHSFSLENTALRQKVMRLERALKMKQKVIGFEPEIHLN